MNRALLAASAFLCGSASAAEFGEWQVEVDSEYVIAQTSNDSESAFGLICFQNGCSFYVSTGTACEADAAYPLLINAPSAASYVQATCFVDDDSSRYYLLISDEDGAVAASVKDRGEIGFALPLQSGRFSVSRFSLDGAERAVERALRSQTQLGRRNGSSDSRRRPVLGDQVL